MQSYMWSSWNSRGRLYQSLDVLLWCVVIGLAFAIEEDAKMPKLFPFTAYDGIGFFLTAICISVCAGSGIGGGGILVPLYILVMDISPIYAIPLSNVTVLGGSLANTALNWKKRHPLKDRPLIDFDFAVVMEPPTMVGAMIGTIVNKNTPVWLITILLVIVLFSLTYRTFWQGFKRYHRESVALAHKRHSIDEDPTIDKEEQNPISGEQEGNPVIKATDGPDEEPQGGGGGWQPRTTLTPEAEAEEDPLLKSAQGGSPAKKSSPALAELYEEEKTVPWRYVFLLAVMFSVVLACLLSAKLSSVKCGSAIYWTIETTPIMLAVVLFVGLFTYIISAHRHKVELEYEFAEGDILWTHSMTLIAAFVCFVAGLFAGLFGVGGGLVKGPQMIEMGMLPEVASATTAFMIIWTSASATVSFGALGLVAWDYAAFLFCIGVAFTWVGQLIFDFIIRKYNSRSSYTVFLIAIVLGLSTVLLGYISIRQTAHTFESENPNAVKGTCG